MDNLIGFIIFLVIIVISIINKIRTESKDSQERPAQRDRPVSMEDIPEATRRMLYGDGSGIQVAKPRTATPEQARSGSATHPVTARRVDVESTRSAPPPTPSRPPQPVRQMGPQASVRAEKREMPTMARHQTSTAQAARRQYTSPQRFQPRSRPQPQPVRRHAVKPDRKASGKRPVPPTRRPQQQPKTVPIAASSGGSGISGLLASKNDLARGILLREILGPPKAFEDFG